MQKDEIFNLLFKKITNKEASPCMLFSGIDFDYIFKFALKILSFESSTPESILMRQINVLPNYLQIRSESQITIDQSLSIQKFLSNHSFESGNRIIVIDFLDNLNNFAANSLLKICEEPPQDTIILALSKRFHKIPATLRSRFLKFTFDETENFDQNLFQNIKNAVILAYKKKIEDLRFWIQRNVTDTTNVDEYIKMILTHIHNGALKDPSNKRLLESYKLIQKFENSSFNPKHYIFNCLLYLTKEY